MREPQQLVLNSVLEELSRTPVAILAGGTDFYPALGDRQAPAQVVDITRIGGLRGIDQTDSGWRIGAGTTWTDIVNHPLPLAFQGLKSAAREVGSVQIQNAGTVAGNLCNASPAADGVPPLLALNASVELASSRGHRILPLSAFILGPRHTELKADELMVAIHVPQVHSDARSVFRKLGARRYLVISIAMASVTLVPDSDACLQDVRIAVGACSAVAQRLPELEQALIGQSMHADLLSNITPGMFSALSPIDDVRGSGWYRGQAAQGLVKRLLLDCVQQLPAYQAWHQRSPQAGVDE